MKAVRALMRFTSNPPLHPPIEPRVCQGEVFCGCGLTLQEGRYRVVINGPIYGREIGRDEFTRWLRVTLGDADFGKSRMIKPILLFYFSFKLPKNKRTR